MGGRTFKLYTEVEFFCWILQIHVFSLLFMWHSMWKANQRHVCYPNFKFYLLHTQFAVQHAVKCLSKQTGCRRGHAISGLPSCCRDRCVLTQCAKLATTSLSTITLTAMSEKIWLTEHLMTHKLQINSTLFCLRYSPAQHRHRSNLLSQPDNFNTMWVVISGLFLDNPVAFVIRSLIIYKCVTSYYLSLCTVTKPQ